MTAQEIFNILLLGSEQTLIMVFASSLLALIAGLPLGALLYTSRHPLLTPAPVLYRVVSLLVNFLRSMPFIILMIALIPLTRALTGSSIGLAAAVVPLAVAAAAFFARLVELALNEVPGGIIEAALAMGANHHQLMAWVLLPEALPALIRGYVVMVVALVGYSAMAGAVGGGGLGDVAIRFGYERFEVGIMALTMILLLLMVQCVQWLGDGLANRLTR